MGSIYYGGAEAPINIEDRALAHLKVVIATKLRRGESFTVSWEHAEGEAPGRSTIWLHPSIPLRFVFDDVEPANLNRAWIEQLATASYSTGGIILTAEHIEAEPAPASSAPTSVALGNVEVAGLDVDKLTLAGRNVKAVPGHRMPGSPGTPSS
jgi:hypothetical protein